ncbi:MAG TPA: hypothetical protein ENN25_07465 [Euryarchaeota archaeon]|nr:hypothetical protein [Euryarchaeota archaeon]
MFPQKYSALVLGTPGAGMLEFCSYLASFYLKHDQSVVFVEADTSASLIRKQLLLNGVKADQTESSTFVLIDCYSSKKLSDESRMIADLGNLPMLLETIREVADACIEPVRIIFDSLSPLHIYSSPEDVLEFIRHLSALAKEKGSLTITLHREMHVQEQVEAIVSICDGLIEMKVDEHMSRYIRISRMNDLDITPKWVPLEIGSLDSQGGASLLWSREDKQNMDKGK